MLRATIGRGYAASGYSAAIADARTRIRLAPRRSRSRSFRRGSGAGTNVPPLTAKLRAATKRSSSSWLMPLRIGTRANRPPGQRCPDRLGEDLAVDDARDRCAREVVDEVGDRHLAQARCGLILAAHMVAANVCPAAFASARDCWVSANAPLWTIARWKSPREPREIRWASTERPPADWPAIVTLRGSPPNARCCAHPAQRRLLIHQAVVAGRTAAPARRAQDARGSRAPRAGS